MKIAIGAAVFIAGVLGVVAQQSQSTTVPSDLRNRVAAAPDPNRKVDLLAIGVLTVQGQVGKLRTDADRAFINQKEQLQTNSQRIQAIEQEDFKSQIAALQSSLDELRTATCPLLRDAKLKDADKLQINKICKSDSAQAKETKD
jgi:hypothetical protein